jgi:hypothetical protein
MEFVQLLRFVMLQVLLLLLVVLVLVAMVLMLVVLALKMILILLLVLVLVLVLSLQQFYGRRLLPARILASLHISIGSSASGRRKGLALTFLLVRPE